MGGDVSRVYRLCALRRHAIQFLAACLRDMNELKLNFKHVAP